MRVGSSNFFFFQFVQERKYVICSSNIIFICLLVAPRSSKHSVECGFFSSTYCADGKEKLRWMPIMCTQVCERVWEREQKTKAKIPFHLIPSDYNLFISGSCHIVLSFSSSFSITSCFFLVLFSTFFFIQFFFHSVFVAPRLSSLFTQVSFSVFHFICLFFALILFRFHIHVLSALFCSFYLSSSGGVFFLFVAFDFLFAFWLRLMKSVFRLGRMKMMVFYFAWWLQILPRWGQFFPRRRFLSIFVLLLVFIILVNHLAKNHVIFCRSHPRHVIFF